MSFNPKKCYIMKMHRARTSKSGDYSFCSTVLQQVKHNPYLGVMLSEDAKWSEHINKTVKKANSTLGFLRRNLRQCPPKLKELAYQSLVRSTLEYASVVWDPYQAKDIKHLEAVQRRAARFTLADYRRSVTKMMKSLEWTTLQERRRHARLLMMYKIINSMVAISAEPILVPASSRTRVKHQQKFQHLSTNTTIYKQSFFPRTFPEWNTLQQDVVGSESAALFKSRLTKSQ
jgi:hypothetical protein